MNKRLTIAFLVSGALALLIGALATQAQIPADSNLRFKQWHSGLETAFNTRIFWMQVNSVSDDGKWAEIPYNWDHIYISNQINAATGVFNYVFTTNRTRFLANEAYYDLIAGGENGNGLLWSNVSGVSAELQANEWRFSGPVKMASLVMTNNTVFTYADEPIATNANASSNITLTFGTSGRGERRLYITNSINVTNITGAVDGQRSSLVLRVVPQLITRSVVFPTIGANFGIRWGTNSGNALLTSLATGAEYEYVFTAQGTNVDASVRTIYFQ